ILEQAHDLVREAVLVDAVAEADQSVDLAHQPECALEAGGIAVKVGDDAEFHCDDPATLSRHSCTGKIKINLSAGSSCTGHKPRISRPAFSVSCSGVLIAPSSASGAARRR